MFRKTLLLIVTLLTLMSAPLLADGANISFLLGGLTKLGGGVISSGWVYAYAAGTTNLKTIYSDAALTTALDNPVQLDAAGRLVAYGDGQYKFVVKDQYLNTLFTADNVEVTSLASLLTDTTDPFGASLSQTNLLVTNAIIASATITDLAVLNAITLSNLSVNNTQLGGVATATLATQAANLGQVQALVNAVSPTGLMTTTGSNASTTVTLTNLTTTGPLTPAGGTIEPYAKYHRVATMTLALADTWEDVEWDYYPLDETSFGFTLLSSSTIEVASAALVQISGCVRPRWAGGAATVATVASRVVYSTDAGVSWSEARCLQAVEGKENGENEVGTMGYHGSISATAGTRIKLQAKVSNVSMLLAGWPGFNNPVAATISLFTTGL